MHDHDDNDQLGFDLDAATGHFGGDTYDEKFDKDRLGKQAKAVHKLMLDSEWRSLAEIASATGAPEASVSARLRDFRKARWGHHVVDRRRRTEGGGTWEYRMLPPKAARQEVAA